MPEMVGLADDDELSVGDLFRGAACLIQEVDVADGQAEQDRHPPTVESFAHRALVDGGIPCGAHRRRVRCEIEGAHIVGVSPDDRLERIHQWHDRRIVGSCQRVPDDPSEGPAGVDRVRLLADDHEAADTFRGMLTDPERETSAPRQPDYVRAGDCEVVEHSDDVAGAAGHRVRVVIMRSVASPVTAMVDEHQAQCLGSRSETHGQRRTPHEFDRVEEAAEHHDGGAVPAIILVVDAGAVESVGRVRHSGPIMTHRFANSSGRKCVQDAKRPLTWVLPLLTCAYSSRRAANRVVREF